MTSGTPAKHLGFEVDLDPGLYAFGLPQAGLERCNRLLLGRPGDGDRRVDRACYRKPAGDGGVMADGKRKLDDLAAVDLDDASVGWLGFASPDGWSHDLHHPDGGAPDRGPDTSAGGARHVLHLPFYLKEAMLTHG